MKKTLLIYVLLGWCTTAFSQTGVLTGSVLDAESKILLELATISVFGQDSTLITYKLSDKEGQFLFDKLPLKRKMIVSVTYTGYSAHYTSVELNAGKTDTLRVLLGVNNKDSNSVVVTTTIPIRMNGDTLEINPGAFKMKEDAVVEELLNQVSGITIWSDGTITVNGKRVQNLLVDGKPFLGSNDTRVATQNLPKSAIDKIQLYQEYDRSNINRQTQPQDSLLTMNIKLKESSKKGYFGKAGFGYGTAQRFESDLSFQVYDKKSSAGIGGGFNNINKSIGNLQEIFQNNTYRNYNPNLYNVGRFGGSGINKNHSIGGVFTHSFIEAANSRQNNRIAINYNKSGVKSYVTDLSLQNRTTTNSSQFIREEGIQNNLNDRHDIGINYVKTNSYNDNLNLNGAVNTSNETGNSSRLTEVRDSINQLQSSNSSISTQNRRSDNESFNANFAKSDRDNPLKAFTLQVDGRRGNATSERDVRSVFQSFVDPSKNTTFNRSYITNNNSLNLSGDLGYNGLKRLLLGRYNLFGIGVSFNQRFNYSRTVDMNHVTDYDTTVKQHIMNTKLTNQNKRELFEYAPTLRFDKNLLDKYTEQYYQYIITQFEISEQFKRDNNSSSIVERNINRSFRFLAYNGSLNYQYSKQKKYRYNASLSYDKNFDYPSIEQLYTVVDDINVYNIRFGNPLLRNRINHAINLRSNFNTQKPEELYSVNGSLGVGYTRAINPTVDSTINEASGRRLSYYINADHGSSLNFNYNFNISRKINKSRLQLMYDGRYNTSNQPNYVDGLYNISETGNLTNNFTLQLTLKSILVLTAGKTLQSYNTKQTAAGLRSFKNSNNITKLGAVLNYPKNFTFSSTLDNIDNSNLAKPTILWNSFATYRFMKQQAELKFSAMDLLKQFQNISNSANPYGTTTRVTNGLQQYFLLTFSYYPRKFGKTEVKKQSSNVREVYY